MKGSEIKITRKLLGKTQAEFAKLFDYTSRTWRDFENDNKPVPLDVIKRLREIRKKADPHFLKDLIYRVRVIEETNKEFREDFRTLSHSITLMKEEILKESKNKNSKLG